MLGFVGKAWMRVIYKWSDHPWINFSNQVFSLRKEQKYRPYKDFVVFNEIMCTKTDAGEDWRQKEKGVVEGEMC